MQTLVKLSIQAVVMLVVVLFLSSTGETKLLRRSRYYDNDNFDGPYGPAGIGPMATGERALITVRGARSPYDGSAPSRIQIEDQPWRGPYPRGVYDRLDSGYGPRPMGYGPRPDGPYGAYNNGPYGGSSFDRPMFGAPSRIGVTGAFPYGYGSRGF